MAPTAQTIKQPVEVWEQYRHVITQLHTKENWPLRKVMEHMLSKHNFSASKAQYERYLKKWGLSKNVKVHDWVYIVRQIQERSSVGKESDLFYHESLVNPDRVRRAVERYGKRHLYQKLTKVLDQPLPLGYRIATPVPKDEPQSWEVKITFTELEDFLRGTNMLIPLSQLTSHIQAGPYRSLTTPSISGLPSAAGSLMPTSYSPDPMQLSINDQLAQSVASSNATMVLPALRSLFPTIYFQGAPDTVRSDSSGAIILRDNEYFNSAYTRLLLFSVINNFAGIDKLPPKIVWNYLKAAAERLLPFIRSVPGPLARALAKNLMRSALEAGDAEAVDWILGESSFNIDVNTEIVVTRMNRSTLVERAISLGDIPMIQTLIRRGADVNKSYRPKARDFSFQETSDINLHDSSGAIFRAIGFFKARPRLIEDPNHAISGLLISLLQAGATPNIAMMKFILCTDLVVAQAVLGSRDSWDVPEWTNCDVTRRFIKTKGKDISTMLKLLRLSKFHFRKRNEGDCKWEWGARCCYHPSIVHKLIRCGEIEFAQQVKEDLETSERPLTQSTNSMEQEAFQDKKYYDNKALEADILAMWSDRVDSIYEFLSTRLVGFEEHIKSCVVVAAQILVNSSPIDLEIMDQHMRSTMNQWVLSQTLDCLFLQALRKGDKDIAKIIVETNNQPASLTCSMALETLLLAVKTGDPSTVAYVMARADRNVVNERLNIERYCEKKRPVWKRFQALVDTSRNPEQAVGKFITPLMVAVSNCDREMVEFLIDAGANINREYKMDYQDRHDGMDGDGPFELSDIESDDTVEMYESESSRIDNESRKSPRRSKFSARRKRLGVSESNLENYFEDFQSEDLEEEDTESENLEGFDFGRAAFESVNLERVNLEGEELEEMHLEGGTIEAENIEGDLQGLASESENSENDGYRSIYDESDSLGSEGLRFEDLEGEDIESVSENYRNPERGEYGKPSFKFCFPLLSAAMYGNLEMMELLFSKGADPMDPRALLASVQRPNGQAITELILDHFRARYPMGRLGFGTKVLQYATKKKDIVLVRQLVRNMSYISFAQLSFDAYDPITNAIRRECPARFWIIQELLGMRNRPDLNSRSFRITPLVLAVRQKDQDIVKLLVEHGARVNYRHSERVLNSRVSRTSLEAACEIGSMGMVECLLQLGADVNFPPHFETPATALQLAAIGGYAGIVSLLIEHGADIDFPALGSYGRTALEGAAEHGRLDTVQLLLNARTPRGRKGRKQLRKAARFARKNGHFGVLQLLDNYTTSKDKPDKDLNYVRNDEVSSSGLGSDIEFLDLPTTPGGENIC